MRYDYYTELSQGNRVAHRADPGRARPHPRSQRRGAGGEPAGLPARAGARAGARSRQGRSTASSRSDCVRDRRRRRTLQAHDQVAPHVRQRADPPAHVRRGRRALRRASLRVPGRGHQAAPDALLSATASSPCTRSATWRDQRERPREDRSQRLRRHLADRQARHRSVVREGAARHQRLPRRSWSTRRAAPCSGRARSMRDLQHAGADVRSTTSFSRSTCRRSASPKRSSAAGAARSSRIDPNNGDVHRAREPRRASIPTCSARGLTRAEYARAAATTSTCRCSIARCAARIRPARPSSRGWRSRGSCTTRSSPTRPSSAPASTACPAAAGSPMKRGSDRPARLGGPARCDRAVLRRVLLRSRQHARRRSASPRSSRRSASAAHRHRHRRREAGPAAVARMEAQGTSRGPQDQVWFPGETVNFGIGQGYFLVTPLQLAHYTSILANRGKSYKPRLVTGVARSAHGQDQARRTVRQERRDQDRHRRSSGRSSWKAWPARSRPRHGRGHRRQEHDLHDRRQDRHRAGVHASARTRGYNEKTVSRAAARPLVVHRVRAGRSTAHRRGGARRERRLRLDGRRADRAQGDGHLPARCRTAS